MCLILKKIQRLITLTRYTRSTTARKANTSTCNVLLLLYSYLEQTSIHCVKNSGVKNVPLMCETSCLSPFSSCNSSMHTSSDSWVLLAITSTAFSPTMGVLESKSVKHCFTPPNFCNSYSSSEHIVLELLPLALDSLAAPVFSYCSLTATTTVLTLFTHSYHCSHTVLILFTHSYHCSHTVHTVAHCSLSQQLSHCFHCPHTVLTVRRTQAIRPVYSDALILKLNGIHKLITPPSTP